jgi:hypothetical protein
MAELQSTLMIGLKPVVDIQANGTIQSVAGYNEPVVFRNIPVGGGPCRTEIKYETPATTTKSVLPNEHRQRN